MKLGIIGLPNSGKNTVFEALTRNFISTNKGYADKICTIKVEDKRLDTLSSMYNPKKTVPTQLEYFLPSSKKNNLKISKTQDNLNQVRNCDALIQVIRNFDIYGANTSSLQSDYITVNQELILSDLITVENRLERLALDKKRGKKTAPEELSLLEQCLNHLEKEKPLRNIPEIAMSKSLRGYAFLSVKPVLILINNDEENDKMPEDTIIKKNHCMIIRAKLEKELAQMTKDEAKEFLYEFNISAPATNKIVLKSYSLLKLISFFTVGKDEVKAWSIKKDTTALNAAKVIHSDIKKGFIRAELVSYKDLIKFKTHAKLRKEGKVRLEGKTYVVRDGDIINFRFNI